MDELRFDGTGLVFVHYARCVCAHLSHSWRLCGAVGTRHNSPAPHACARWRPASLRALLARSPSGKPLDASKLRRLQSTVTARSAVRLFLGRTHQLRRFFLGAPALDAAAAVEPWGALYLADCVLEVVETRDDGTLIMRMREAEAGTAGALLLDGAAAALEAHTARVAAHNSALHARRQELAAASAALLQLAPQLQLPPVLPPLPAASSTPTVERRRCSPPLQLPSPALLLPPGVQAACSAPRDDTARASLSPAAKRPRCSPPPRSPSAHGVASPRRSPRGECTPACATPPSGDACPGVWCPPDPPDSRRRPQTPRLPSPKADADPNSTSSLASLDAMALASMEAVPPLRWDEAASAALSVAAADARDAGAFSVEASSLPRITRGSLAAAAAAAMAPRAPTDAEARAARRLQRSGADLPQGWPTPRELRGYIRR